MPDKALIIKEAQRYLARGQIDRAIAEWERLVKEAPDGNSYNTIGDLYLKKGDKSSAVESFHKAADFFRQEGFSLKALALFKKIINIDPSDVGSLIALGELSEEKGLITDAIKYYLSAADILSKDVKKERFLSIYERILSLAPFNLPLREKVAGLFLKEGLTSDAVREYLYIARLCDDRGDSKKAEEFFRKVIEIEHDNKDALLGLSYIYEKAGNIHQAIEYTKKAIKIHKGDADLLLRCATLLKASGAFDDALTYLSEVLEIRPFDIEANRLIGEIHLLRGDREKAWESYKIVVNSLMVDGRVEDAIGIVSQFKDINPIEAGKLLIPLYRQGNDMEALFKETLFVADLLSDTGIHNEAIELYREALKIHPEDMKLRKMIAELEMKMGIEPAAIEKEKTAEDLLTDADIFIKYGLYDEARAILEDLKIKEPYSMEVHARLKSLYIETNDREQAVTECLILAELYGREGDIEKREAVLKEAFEINPEDPRLLERMFVAEEQTMAAPVSEGAISPNLDDYIEDMAEAEFYLRQGLKDDALRIYERLLNMFPENEDLRNKVSSLGGVLPEPLVGEAPAGIGGGVQIEEIKPQDKETIEAHELAEPQLDSDVLDIFEEFKKGIEKELEAEDYETHYNLGIAYKEMGLIDDAIKEFQTSRDDPKCYVRSTSMLGVCYMEKGLYPLAIDAFRAAMNNIETRDESYWGAMYDLASAYEKNGNIREAFEIFSEIYGRDSKFREVAERLDRLKSQLSKGDTMQKERKDRISYL
ncbi:MAG: hypothetical protein OHK0032_09720 [Thermodesulfovibrionales bacterium]